MENDGSLPAFLQPDTISDIRYMNSNYPSHPYVQNASQPGPTSNALGATGINFESVLDSYFYNQDKSGEFAPIFYNCIAGCFGLTALNALNDVWNDLNGKNHTLLLYLKRLISSACVERSEDYSLSSLSDDHQHDSSAFTFDENEDKTTSVIGLMNSRKLVCTRVSTIQRGGVWVLGRKLLHGRILLMLLNQCGTLNDVVDVMDLVMKDLKRS
jgi:hypothetical protein